MAATEERLKILTLIRDGKITADEGIRLIAALEAQEQPRPANDLPRPANDLPRQFPSAPKAPQPARPAEPPHPAEPASPGRQPRWLVVRITDLNSGKLRVNVRLPVAVITMGMKMGAKFSPEIEGLNAQELKAVIESGSTGQMADIYNEDSGEHVEVFIE